LAGLHFGRLFSQQQRLVTLLGSNGGGIGSLKNLSCVTNF
jgi:hypothetical protein